MFITKAASLKRVSHSKYSKSECQSPTMKSRSRTPIHKHNCSPHSCNLVLPRPQGPSFDYCTGRFSKIELPMIKKKLTKLQTIQIRKRIELNKDYLKLLPTQKLELAKQSAAKNKLRGEITRLTKNNIIIQRKKTMQVMLNLKEKKYEFRKKNYEIVNIKQCWINLYCSIGISYIISNFIKNRLKLRKRSENQLIWLQQICKCIGKIIIKLKQNKEIRTLKVFYI